MKTMTIAYISTLVVFVAIDFIWLSTMANVLYRPAIGDLLAPTFRLAPAVIFYLVYAAGLTYFAVRGAVSSGDLTVALVNGALFGFFAYATYDLTNQATLKNWSTTLTIADLAWGSALSAIAATASTVITRKFG